MSADIDFDGLLSSPLSLVLCLFYSSFCPCHLSYPPSYLTSAEGPKLAWSYLRFHPVKRVFPGTVTCMEVRLLDSWCPERHSQM